MTIGSQAGMDVELEGAIGEQRDGLRKLSTCGEPSGGLFEDQPRCAHEHPAGPVRCRVLVLLAYRLAIHLDAIGVVNQPVQDAVGDGWIADLHMPTLYRQLTGWSTSAGK